MTDSFAMPLTSSRRSDLWFLAIIAALCAAVAWLLWSALCDPVESFTLRQGQGTWIAGSDAAAKK